jgi:hypothetical protein
VSGLGAIATLVLARARRRPGRWLLMVAGIALATAFAGAVAAESTIAGDQAARSSLAGLTPLARTVRITWPGVVTPSVERRARSLMGSLGIGQPTEVVLLQAVRLGGVIVAPAAISPLAPWVGSRARPGPCRAISCPMLLAGAHLPLSTLTAQGIRIPIAGTALVRSAAPLGFAPEQPSGQPPLLLTGDVAGLETLPGLASVYRTHDWFALLPTSELNSWQLAQTERRLLKVQAALVSSGSGFSLTAPFAGLEAARSDAAAAPTRLLLAGGGALAALALFVVLAAGALRRELEAELGRLAAAGARMRHSIAFVLIECALLCSWAVLLGGGLAVLLAALLAHAAGVPVDGVLSHGLLTGTGAAALVAGWLCATALVAVLLLLRGQRLAELLAVAAAAGLALALTRGANGTDPLPVLLAPLCCLAAGVIVARLAAVALRGGERVARRGPVMTRLAFAGLARSPGPPSLAIAFIAVSIGLGGFALAYRATLLRSTVDQAASQVPLDATVSAGADFTTPLQVASPARWATLARGSVTPVRRTEASFQSGASSVTVPALGVPAAVIPRLHGWRPGDSTVPLATLARRLVPSSPSLSSSRAFPKVAAALSVRAQSSGMAVTVTADFLDPDDNLEQVTLGHTGPRSQRLLATLPRVLRTPGPGGGWRLAGLELDEPSGLEITNGHQNAENPTGATHLTGVVKLGALTELGPAHRLLGRVALSSWRALGAAGGARVQGAGVTVEFDASGKPGLLRPATASDPHPVPVLADPQTAAASGPGNLIALDIDGLPVTAHVVGVLRRFPTVPAGDAGFVIADEQTLASALDAQLPGQGRPDELWISTARPQTLEGALGRPPFAQFAASFRGQIERQLRAAPVSRAVLRTLLAAAALSGALALLGLLVALLGGARDERVECDLIAQGVGPRGLRAELRMRLLLTATIGVGLGLGVGLLLTRLAVATVRGAGAVAVPEPPLVTVAPWAQLLFLGAAALALLAGASWLAARALAGRAAS